MRDPLAEKYIRGRGIEIGGLHFPLPIPHGAKVTYVDMIPPEAASPDVRHLVKVKELVIDDAETLSKFPNESLDFIIANHVLEHCHDPIGTLKVWANTLLPGGIVFAAVPEKTQTFDRDRKITTLEHLKDDHILGTTDGRDAEHYREWFRVIEQKIGPELERRIQECLLERTNIHFHVWDNPAQLAFVQYIQSQGILELVEFVPNGAETIWILRKPS